MKTAAAEILVGDCWAVLAQMADCSVNCCVTSIPYWGLRDYGVAGQIGLEVSVEAWLAEIVAVFREVYRVLRDDGTLWLNIGNAYSGSGRGGYPGGQGSLEGSTTGQDQARVAAQMMKSRRKDDAMIPRSAVAVAGLRPKNLIGMPWRVAFALQAEGWNLRSEIIWHKPNAMPESCIDRPTTSHEQIFLLTKSDRKTWWRHRDTREWRSSRPAPDYRWRNIQTHEEIREEIAEKGWVRINLWRGMDYWFDRDAIAVECSDNTHARVSQDVQHQRGSSRANGNTRIDRPMNAVVARGINPKARVAVPSGWATGAGTHGTIHANGARPRQNASFSADVTAPVLVRNSRTVWTIPTQGYKGAHFATFPRELAARCIKAGCPAGGLVLDPFAGTGTTVAEAVMLGRRGVGIELNPDYAQQARRRIHETCGLLAGGAA